VFSATETRGGKTKINIDVPLLNKISKPKLYDNVKIVLGAVRTLVYVYEICLRAVPLNLNINLFYPMYCHSVYCNSVHKNRYTIVHMLLSHVHLSSPFASANRNSPQHKQTKTKHAHTQYIQASVHTQFASPPGGESMYISIYVYMCISRSNISKPSTLYNEQFKRYFSVYVLTSGEMSKLLSRFIAEKITQNRQNLLSVHFFFHFADYGIVISPFCYSILNWIFSMNLYSDSQLCRQFSVRNIPYKMSEPGEDSQSSRPMSAGEYLYLMHSLKYVLLLFRYFQYKDMYCCNCSLSYRE
jgi:hypothetical protein